MFASALPPEFLFWLFCAFSLLFLFVFFYFIVVYILFSGLPIHLCFFLPFVPPSVVAPASLRLSYFLFFYLGLLLLLFCSSALFLLLWSHFLLLSFPCGYACCWLDCWPALLSSVRVCARSVFVISLWAKPISSFCLSAFALVPCTNIPTTLLFCYNICLFLSPAFHFNSSVFECLHQVRRFVFASTRCCDSMCFVLHYTVLCYGEPGKAGPDVNVCVYYIGALWAQWFIVSCTSCIFDSCCDVLCAMF